MDSGIGQLSVTARRAAAARDWATVRRCAGKILGKARQSAEGHFLMGLAEKSQSRYPAASRSLATALAADSSRYDAAIELADLYVRSHEFGGAASLLAQHESALSSSPKYLDMAGTLYMRIGLPDRAIPLFRRATELQPDADSLRAHLAECSVFVGDIDGARAIYEDLLKNSPGHQRLHYELSRLGRARDRAHIDRMEAILGVSGLPAERNIYLYYALGKELEDIECWDEAFRYYEMGGAAAASVANYDVGNDVALIDEIISNCDSDWYEQARNPDGAGSERPRPLFVVGLPRSGTTLTERILSCHSQVGTVGETLFVPLALRKASGVGGRELVDANVLRAAAGAGGQPVAAAYLDAVAYKQTDKPLFVEKFPENFLYLGFIAAAFPDSPIVWVNRNPMDNCFALFKQSFFRYAYTLDDVGRYYAAYRSLHDHWRSLLGDRLIELDYERLVANQEEETRRLLARVELPFEEACLEFENNTAASNTASTVQVREKIHSRSVGRWKYFARHLEPLRQKLGEYGVDV